MISRCPTKKVHHFPILQVRKVSHLSKATLAQGDRCSSQSSVYVLRGLVIGSLAP